MATPELALEWVQSKLLGSGSPGLSLDAIFPVLEFVRSTILQDGHAPEVDAVREVDRRLKLCKNPEKVAGSKAFLAKQVEEERKAEDKRSKKVSDAQKGQSDPFGETIQSTSLVDYGDDDDD
jgi:cyclin H